MIAVLGQRDALVELRDRGVVPLRDLPHEDLGERRAVHVQEVLDAGQVVHDRRSAERPRDLLTAVAGVELIRGERRVARAEVDGAGRDRGDAAAGADRAVLELDAVGRAERRDPLRDERRDERAAGAGDGGRLAGCLCICRPGDDDREKRGGRNGADTANRSAEFRHESSSSVGSRPTYDPPGGEWVTGLFRPGYEVVSYTQNPLPIRCTVSRWR